MAQQRLGAGEGCAGWCDSGATFQPGRGSPTLGRGEIPSLAVDVPHRPVRSGPTKRRAAARGRRKVRRLPALGAYPRRSYLDEAANDPKASDDESNEKAQCVSEICEALTIHAMLGSFMSAVARRVRALVRSAGATSSLCHFLQLRQRLSQALRLFRSHPFLACCPGDHTARPHTWWPARTANLSFKGRVRNRVRRSNITEK